MCVRYCCHLVALQGLPEKPKAMQSLRLKPCSLREANAYIALYHRHHGPVVGAKFAISLVDERGGVHGVVVAGRPVNNHLDDGWTLEVTRLATDGSSNACSMLYSAVCRAAKGMGYRRVVTYILHSEPGTSLRASGWSMTGRTPGTPWNHASRKRTDKHPLVPKTRWERGL